MYKLIKKKSYFLLCQLFEYCFLWLRGISYKTFSPPTPYWWIVLLEIALLFPTERWEGSESLGTYVHDDNGYGKIWDDGKVFWEDIAIFGANYQSEMDKAYSDSIWCRSLKTTTGQNEDDLGDELGRVSMGLQHCEQRTKNSFDNYKKWELNVVAKKIKRWKDQT